jgi:hypothetical protein
VLESIDPQANNAGAAIGPTIAAYTGLAISAVLAVVRLWEFARDLRKRASLRIVQTPHFFVRFAEEGELFFLSLVTFASTRAAFVESATIDLHRLGPGGSKRWPLKLLRVGQPIDRGRAETDHLFFSPSAVDLVPVDQPLRRVYMCAVDASRTTIVGASHTFRAALDSIRREYTELQKLSEGEDRTKGDIRIRGLLESASESFVNSYMDVVQLEGGSYEVTCMLHYRDAGRAPDGQCQSVASTVVFDFSMIVKEELRADLKRLAAKISMQVLTTDPSVLLPYPEFPVEGKPK